MQTVLGQSICPAHPKALPLGIMYKVSLLAPKHHFLVLKALKKGGL